MWRDVVHDFHVDLGRPFRFPEFPTQTFAADVTERLQIFVEILKRQLQARHRHARNARIAVLGKNREGRAISGRKIFENNERGPVLARVLAQRRA